MTTSEEFTEEESKGGDDSQNNDFIYLSSFELLEWLLKRAQYPHNAIFLLFNGFDVALDIAWDGELLEMESEDTVRRTIVDQFGWRGVYFGFGAKLETSNARHSIRLIRTNRVKLVRSSDSIVRPRKK